MVLRIFFALLLMFFVRGAYAATYIKMFKSSNGMKFALAYDEFKLEEGPQIYEIKGEDAVKINWDQEKSFLGMSESIFVLDEERTLRMPSAVFQVGSPKLIIVRKSFDPPVTPEANKEDLDIVNDIDKRFMDILTSLSKNQDFSERAMVVNKEGIHDYRFQYLEGSKSIFVVSEYLGGKPALDHFSKPKVYVHEVDKETMGPAIQRVVTNVEQSIRDMYITLDKNITLYIPSETMVGVKAYLQTAPQDSNATPSAEKQSFPLKFIEYGTRYGKIVMKSLNSCKSTFQQ